MKAWEMPATMVAEMVREGSLSAVEYVSKILERTEETEPRINAYITLLKEQALRRAEEVDRTVARGEDPGRLAGVAVAVKDNIAVRGVENTCGSRILKGYRPPFNATVVEKLLREGAVIIGKTNMDEFAMGSTTETSAYGPTRNPWNPERVPGGSSGGSGAALAAGSATLALGSDTGGSIRCPAAYTGTYGLKPTYGAVSRYGLVPYANSLEQIGPMARNTADLALLYSVIVGHDPRDSTSLRDSDTRLAHVDHIDPSRLRIGVIRELVEDPVDPRVSRAVWSVISKLESMGASVEEVSLPLVEYALSAYYIIAMAEASSNLARYDGTRYGFRAPGATWEEMVVETRTRGFGWEVKRRIMLGSFILSAGYVEQYYVKALRVRSAVRRALLELLSKHHVLAGATMPIPAPRLGERIRDPLLLYTMDVATVLANLAGIPALNTPADVVDGAPVGAQFMGPPMGEPLLLGVSRLVEEATRFRDEVVQP